MRNPTPLALAALLLGTPVSAQVAVAPSSQTLPEPAITGGVLRDATLWEAPGNSASSLLLTAYENANTGLVTFGLDGQQVDAELAEGPMSAVAVLDGFLVSGVEQTLVVAASLNANGLTAFTVDTGRADRVVRLGAPGFVTGRQFSAVALHRSQDSGRFYLFAGGADGFLQQYELSGDLGAVTATPVRSLRTSGAVVGLVVDEATESLFVTQQGQGLWRYSTEPDDDGEGQQLAASGGTQLSTNVGRVGLYRARNGEGYILVADPGANAFAVFERRARTFVGTFQLATDGGVISANAPLALAVSAQRMGTSFPDGLFAGSDALSSPQNLKLASWAAVADAFEPPLRVDTRSDSDGGTDGGTDGGPGDGGGVIGGPGPQPQPGWNPPSDDSGCSCASASVPSTALLALLALVRLGRRRRD
ncbi:myxosortase-dependent phytase-like phosphatase [Myxococcus sp. Y35]|uniref:myxosortase-dependent phytase-like phosphatase n=1 Tax=Pseudomyxococcus flavus TaxID=3115648 RepID=UPI003CE841EE